MNERAGPRAAHRHRARRRLPRRGSHRIRRIDSSTPISTRRRRGCISSAEARTVYFYPLRIVSRLERRFEEVRDHPVRIEWFNGPLVDERRAKTRAAAAARRRFVRPRHLCAAARTARAPRSASPRWRRLPRCSSAPPIGGVAGYAGGAVDELLSRFSDFVLVLPAIYVVARAARRDAAGAAAAARCFALLAGIFALVGWPVVARGVRGIIASEREREYVTAGRAAGAGPLRLLAVHLMPAARGYLLTQATLLLPAFILAEATLSYVGLGFPDSVPTWGTMLHNASNVALVGEAPWMLAPAAAIFLVVLAGESRCSGSGRSPA